MSLVVEAVSSSTNMGLEENKGDKTEIEDNGDEKGSESSICETEDEGEDAESHKIDLGPQYTLKQQFEKDKVQIFIHFLHFLSFPSIIPFCHFQLFVG